MERLADVREKAGVHPMSRRHPEDPPGYNRRWPADRPVRTCSIDGCGKPHASRGYCNLHYTRLKKYGDPNFTQRAYGVKRRKDAAGYVWLYEPDHPLAQTHGYVAEHRKVMWEAGLLTDLNAHVHHRNHDKGDNRLENLEVLTAEQHTRRHLAEEGKVTNPGSYT